MSLSPFALPPQEKHGNFSRECANRVRRYVAPICIVTVMCCVVNLLRPAEESSNEDDAPQRVPRSRQGKRDFQNAIEAYKMALRFNPNDDETRYNLVLCQRQLKKQGGGQNNQQNKQDDQQDQQKQEQQKQEQQQQKQDKQQEQQEPPMSKENAEQLLNAAMQQEKQTQQRMQEAQKQQSKRRRIEKNW